MPTTVDPNVTDPFALDDNKPVGTATAPGGRRFDPSNPYAARPTDLTPDESAAWNTDTYQWMSGSPTQQSNSTRVASAINPSYKPPAGDGHAYSLNSWGYYVDETGNLAPNQNTPGSMGFTPVDANGNLNPQGQALANSVPPPTGATPPPDGSKKTVDKLPPPPDTTTGPGAPPPTSYTFDNTPATKASTAAPVQTQQYTDLMSKLATAATPQQSAIAQDDLARTVFDNLEAAGYDVKWQDDFLIVDGRKYSVGDAVSRSTYKPGDINTNDIPNLSLDDWLKVAGQKTDVENLTDQVISDILKDPFGGFDDNYSNTLKAQAKDTSADTFLQEQQQIKDSARQLGQDVTTSPWAQSELLTSRRSRDMSLAGTNANIDIQTQSLRDQKQREAGSLGLTASGQAAAARNAAVSLAADSVFKQAAATNDRLTLMESVKQKAAELGIQTEQVMDSYIVAKQKELTSRIGIMANYDIDRRKLDEQSTEFKSTLMMTMAQLDEQMRQFDATYGQNAARLNEQSREFDATNDLNKNIFVAGRDDEAYQRWLHAQPK